MPKAKRTYKRKAADGSVRLRLSLDIVTQALQLHDGDTLTLTGTSQTNGVKPAVCDQVQMGLSRTNDALCLDLQAAKMGSIFQQKLCDVWQCDLVNIAIEEQEHISPSQSVLNCDDKEILCKVLSIIKREEEGRADIQSDLLKTDENLEQSINDKSFETIEATPLAEKVIYQGLFINEEDDNISDSSTTEESLMAEKCSNHARESVTEDEPVTPTREFICRFCHKSFEYSKLPKKSCKSHEVRVCRRNPNSVVNVTLKSKHTVSDSFPFGCDQCPEAFKSRNGLSQHQRKVHSAVEQTVKWENQEMFQCDMCDRQFMDDRARKLHKTICHGVTEPRKRYDRPKIAMNLTCEHCEETFSSMRSHQLHVKYRCKVSPDTVKCSYCNFCLRPFPADKLDAHKREKHQNHARKVCELCGAVFVSRNGLYKHKRHAHHTRPPQWHCQPCLKSYQFKFQLDRHLVKHSDERAVMCPVCGKFFKHNDQMAQHRHRVHGKRVCDSGGQDVQNRSSPGRRDCHQTPQNHTQMDTTLDTPVAQLDHKLPLEKRKTVLPSGTIVLETIDHVLPKTIVLPTLQDTIQTVNEIVHGHVEEQKIQLNQNTDNIQFLHDVAWLLPKYKVESS